MKLADICDVLADFAPLRLQENYDNAGLLLGPPDRDIRGIICAHDCTEEVLQEALSLGANLIIVHHPLIFKPLKKITSSNHVERMVEKLIEHKIALYSTHTALDNCLYGGNGRTAEKLGLKGLSILRKQSEGLLKLHTYCPQANSESILNALFEAGAGHIGDYSECSFKAPGNGSFRAGVGTTPHVGEIDRRHHEDEDKLEVILEKHQQSKILKALFKAHPYEEVAYDLVELENENLLRGSGIVGEFENPMSPDAFLQLVADVLRQPNLRFNAKPNKNIQKVAICGGSGDFLTPDALASSVDVFITGDIGYHRFLDLNDELFLVDPGHYESEQFVAEVIHEHLSQKFANFAVHLASPGSPVQYL